MARMKKAKKRPASKAKKVSAKQSRRRPSVAMLVRRSAKRREAVRDPYDIGPAPEGWSYQWVATLIHGDPKPAEYTRAHMEDNGWRPVWPARYPRMPRNADAEIEVGGQVLMERPIELSEEARSEDIAVARKMHDDHPASGLSGAKFVFISPVGSMAESLAVGSAAESLSESGRRGEAAAAEFEAAGGAFDVTIKLTLTQREMETAIALHLPLAEYARRKMLMRSADVLVLVRPGVYSLGEYRVHLAEQ